MLRFLRSNVSFSRQLSTVFVIGILVLALVSSLLISWLVSEAARNHFMNVGLQMTRHFAVQSRLALLYGSTENARLPVKALLGFPDIDHVTIFYADNRVLLSEGELVPEINREWHSLLPDHALLIWESPEDWYFAAKVLPTEAENTGESPFGEEIPTREPLGHVLVTMGKDTLHGMTGRIFVVNAIISMTLASLLLLILRVITKRLTTPLENLCQIMRRAEQGETGIRTDLEGSKDIKEMEHSFNQMMTVLEEREEELKEARDAALETARAKAEFAAVVSHEIRTPLNGVIGMLNLMRERGVPERQQDYLNLAISSGDALLDLINDILDFSKIEAGKLDLEFIEFRPREALEDIAALFSERAQARNLELCLSIPPDLPALVRGDLLRLRQVLTNLLSNAIKFTEHGEVLLAVSWSSLSDQDVALKFAVEDSGIGIPQEARKKIFESFRQADGSTTRKFGGTGLGLSICKQLIALLGGDLEVESEVGRGSRFSFTIKMGLIENFIPEKEFSAYRALVIDGNEHNRAYLWSLLNALGCGCLACENPEKAISELRAHPEIRYDLCLFNINICEKDDVSSLPQTVRSGFPNAILHFVLLIQPGTECFDEAAVDGVLNQPVRLATLKKWIGDQLNGTHAETGRQDSALVNQKLSSIRILIVDDNRTNQLVAKAMLTEFGYQADIASNGREAVKFVSTIPYDLVLMDCSMPVMDGYEATRRIRELSGPSGKTPIFAMTAMDNPYDIRRCHEVGMSDYLLKPLNLENLRKKLSEQFQNHASMAGGDELRTLDACIDADSLANLENAMGAKVADIIEAFLADTPNHIAELKQAYAAEEWNKLASIAHNIKGSSRNLGANLLASVCREIEDRSGHSALPAAVAEKLIQDLDSDYRQVEQALKDKLAVLEKCKSKRVRGEGEMVLIVDDDRSTRLTIAHSLESDGLWIEHAANGQAAVEQFIRLKPDLVIMDAVMPVMNGFDASREIKRLPGGRTTPILIITALENDESVERAFKCGAADFIPKPINLAVLRQRVKRVLDARQSEQRVQHLAYNDSLTGLPNRIAFSDRLQQDLAYAKRNGNQLAVMFVDVDHFKDVNDNLGHAAGDELLKILAERVAGCIRSEDTLARLGGDEFVVVLSSVHGPKGADTAAQNILRALSTPFHIAGREIYIGASIGISIFPDDGANRETLLKNADTAMYRAKALGRNNYQFYTLEMSASISERIELETDLRKVIQRDELILYFHPKVDARSDALIGAEALVRWQHPRRGFLLPDSFIPIAEDAGLIDRIGIWVMQKACEQFQQWHLDKGFGGSVAVNISARQFMEPSFVEEVRQCLEWSGLAPYQLELEITESTILKHAVETIDKLKLLKKMGVKIAIDDFGVGYSSFNYLKQMPVEVLKIDKSFIRDVPDDSSGTAIIDGIIRLAHNLKLEVVAEGVETQSQYQFLKQHNCDTIQGNYISKPLPAGEFYEKYVAARVAEGI